MSICMCQKPYEAVSFKYVQHIEFQLHFSIRLLQCIYVYPCHLEGCVFEKSLSGSVYL